MMVYFLSALALVLMITGIVLSYQKYHDKKTFFVNLALLLVLLIFTYATKILLVYKPLLILHIALLIMAWRGLYLRIFKAKFNPYWIFSPLLSVALFVVIALFFRENG